MTLYEKNLSAMQQNRPQLYKKLSEIETNEKFEVYTADDAINLVDITNGTIFYDDPKKFIEEKKEGLKKYREYPFLYLFGIDNGQMVKELLANKKLSQLVVFEPDIELLYIALNLIDFSEELASNRLVLMELEEASYSMLINLLHVSNAKFYIRTFELIANSTYSETFYEQEYEDLYKLWIKALDYVAQASGNDVNDTFRGLRQHLQNIPQMIETPQYRKLLQKESVKSAVIVSTGPSLDKQIALLKEHQEKICILSVDASFPILIQNGIQPDFVFSMERDEPTAQFFTKMPKKAQKGSIFLCASLQHRAVLDAIDSKLIVMRPFGYNTYFELHEYGYLCKGMSSANMAHEFATAFGFEQITFIGQDLAFGEDLKTHADGHVIEEENELLAQQIKSDKLLEITAYGGKGSVKSNIYWVMFKNFIEHHIQETQEKVQTYNSTEGGAQIEGAREIAFAEFLDTFATETKERIAIRKPSKKIRKELQERYEEKKEIAIEQLQNLKESIDSSFTKIATECKRVENLTEKEALKVFSIGETIELLEEVSHIRSTTQEADIYKHFLASIAHPLMYSMELELAEIKIRYVDNPDDNQLKALQWILAHRFWLFSLSGIIDTTITFLKDNEL